MRIVSWVEHSGSGFHRRVTGRPPGRWRGSGSVFLVLSFLWCGTATGQTFSDPQPAKATLAIVGGYLIDGHEGAPLHNSIVLIDGGRIVAVGAVGTLKVPPGAMVIDAAGYTVMPGLIDSHVHLDGLGLGNPDPGYWHRTYGSRHLEIAAASAKQLLMAGVTTAVDLGGNPSIQLGIRDRINRGELVGPRMKVSCSYFTSLPEAQAKAHYRGGYIVNVRTPEEARAGIQKTIECGADIIKIHNNLAPEQIRIIADEAHKRGLKVTGHVRGNADLLMRLQNGFDGVEHLSFDPADPEVLQELRARRTVVNPTNVKNLAAVLAATEVPGWVDNPKAKALTPPDIWLDIRRSLRHMGRLPYFGGVVRPRVIEEHGKAIKQLYDAGIPIVAGTDSGAQGNFHTDAMWHQMKLLVRFGIPPNEVISAATRVAAEWLGMGRELGTIAPGKLADLIVVDGNPLADMGTLKHVVYVVKEGTPFKGFGYKDYEHLLRAIRITDQRLSDREDK